MALLWIDNIQNLDLPCIHKNMVNLGQPSTPFGHYYHHFEKFRHMRVNIILIGI